MFSALRTTALAFAMLLGVATLARAQAPAPAFPTFDVTGGYQLLHLFAGSDEDDGGLTFPIGLNLDGAWNFSESLGLAGEIGWARKSDDEDGLDVTYNAFNIGVGPRFTARGNAKVQPYGQLFVGALHFRASAEAAGIDISETDTKFMVQPGVGVNYVAGDGWGVVGAVDYRRVFLDEEEDGNTGENEIRVFVGIRMILD
jgi:opacity protein-like surface antigen